MLAIAFAVIYVVCFYMIGFFEGFAKSPYMHDFFSLGINYSTLVGYLVLREMIRQKIIFSVSKIEKRESVFVFISIIFTILNFSFSRFTSINSIKELIQFSGEYLLPEFMLNYLLCILVVNIGVKTSSIYTIIVKGIEYLLPVLPAMKWISRGLLGIVYPMIVITFIEYLFPKYTRRRYRYKKKRENPTSLIITSIISIMMIWFAVGVFPIYPSVIVSGSMIPHIDIGDVIIIKKIDTDQIKVGDIIQFRKDNLDIAHRVEEIIMKDELCFKTKGDNNNVSDSKLVTSKEVRGKVISIVPKLGKLKMMISNSSEIDIKHLDLY